MPLKPKTVLQEHLNLLLSSVNIIMMDIEIANCIFTPEMSRASKRNLPCLRKNNDARHIRAELKNWAPEKELKEVQHYDYIMPFLKILSEIRGVSDSSKKITHEFSKTISYFGTEFDILHKIPVEDIRKRNYILSVAIDRLRKKRIYF